MNRIDKKHIEMPFQDFLTDNTCFGCGADNEQGLRIKSVWSADEPGTTVCNFVAGPQHNAGSPGILNGGIIATIMDCHSVITAIARAYSDEDREFASGAKIWFVTSNFDLQYKAPALIQEPVRLLAKVSETQGKRSLVDCQLWSGEKLCTVSRMTAVRVAPEWLDSGVG